MIDGDLRIGQGGSESLEGTGSYEGVLLEMLSDIGIDLNQFDERYDFDFFKRHGLGAAMFFNEKVFGKNKIVNHPLCDYPGFIEGLLRPTMSVDDAVAQSHLVNGEKNSFFVLLKRINRF